MYSNTTKTQNIACGEEVPPKNLTKHRLACTKVIKNVGGGLKTKVHARKPSNLEELARLTEEEFLRSLNM